jgi:hypothetical protein
MIICPITLNTSSPKSEGRPSETDVVFLCGVSCKELDFRISTGICVTLDILIMISQIFQKIVNNLGFMFYCILKFFTLPQNTSVVS